MITVKTDFAKRKSEIDEYFEFVEIVYSAEKEADIKFKRLLSQSKKQKFIITNQLQKVLIANGFLILYNIVEATVRNSLDEIFEDLQTNEIQYTRLCQKLKKVFLLQRNQNLKEGGFSLDTLNKQTLDLIDFVLNNETVILHKDKLNMSGNLDALKIKKIAGEYGFGIPSGNGENLLTIKNKRNHLAHGDFSFSEIGKDYTIGDLMNFKEQTFNYLHEVIENIENYISTKGYLEVV